MQKSYKLCDCFDARVLAAGAGLFYAPHFSSPFFTRLIWMSP
jgi:hypothetical protein